MRLIVTCPWPPVSVSPNQKRKAHWSAYRGDTKTYREACYWLTREALGRLRPRGLRRVTISFFPPDARHRDDDNMTGAFKAGRDGIAQALGMDDVEWRGKVANQFPGPHRPDGKITVELEFEDVLAS